MHPMLITTLFARLRAAGILIEGLLTSMKVTRIALALGVLSSSCGKVGYDPPEIQIETGFEASPPPSDASQDRPPPVDALEEVSRDVLMDASGDSAPEVSDGPASRVAFVVGSFVKSTTVGGQTVAHGLGQVPKALILWTAGKTAGPTEDYTYAVGVSDGPGSSRAHANASRSSFAPSNATRRMALKAISIVQWGEITLAEADLTSWDAANFDLTWSTNNAAPYVVHYIAIGGAAVSAKIVAWQAPTAPAIKAVTGVGFRPDTVLHFYSGEMFTNPPPFSQVNGSLGMGLVDGAGNQCAYQVAVVDASNPTVTARALKNDASIYMFYERPNPFVMKNARFGSMDPGGFTLDFTAAETSPTQMFSLALGGVRAKVGAFDKSTSLAPQTQPVTGVGFQPGLVVLASVDDVVQPPGVSQPHASLTTGASDGIGQASAAISDADSLTPPRASGADDAMRVFAKIDTFSPKIVAEASMVSLDPDGFSLRWVVNDSAATRICYWALGSP
jgi:hypothetical protein